MATPDLRKGTEDAEASSVEISLLEMLAIAIMKLDVHSVSNKSIMFAHC